NNESGMLEYAIRYLGEDRLLYASDNSFYQSIGNILAADLTDLQRRKIFFGNYNNLLRKGGFNVD
ncbi:MAG: amidohydrolase, partial [Daejeonella sp.]|nr:amidohydrolase [Daejeonella sp.]